MRVSKRNLNDNPLYKIHSRYLAWSDMDLGSLGEKTLNGS